MSIWLGIAIGVAALLVGFAVGFWGKKLVAGGRLIVAEQDGARHIFLELDSEDEVSGKWILLEVKRQKIPGR